jgi:hypothetical protein
MCVLEQCLEFFRSGEEMEVVGFLEALPCCAVCFSRKVGREMQIVGLWDCVI